MADGVPQVPRNLNLDKMPRPQNRRNAEEPGRYYLVFSQPRTTVVRGKEFEVGICVTGYGDIASAKLFFVPPLNLIDADSSFAYYDLGVREEGGPAVFGTTKMQMHDGGLTIDLSSGGVTAKHWPGPPLFFDTGICIASENGTPYPPVRLCLKANKKVATGDHRLSFALTYYNGRDWAMAYRNATLHVPTLYERHEGIAWAIGIVLALVATGATVFGAVSSDSSSGKSVAAHHASVHHKTPRRASDHASSSVPSSLIGADDLAGQDHTQEGRAAPSEGRERSERS
jgi:hypothetical protein